MSPAFYLRHIQAAKLTDQDVDKLLPLVQRGRKTISGMELIFSPYEKRNITTCEITAPGWTYLLAEHLLQFNGTKLIGYARYRLDYAADAVEVSELFVNAGDRLIGAGGDMAKELLDMAKVRNMCIDLHYTRRAKVFETFWDSVRLSAKTLVKVQHLEDGKYKELGL